MQSPSVALPVGLRAADPGPFQVFMVRARGVSLPSNGCLEPPQAVESPRCSSGTIGGRPLRPGGDRAFYRRACGGRPWCVVPLGREEVAARPPWQYADPIARAEQVVRVLKFQPRSQPQPQLQPPPGPQSRGTQKPHPPPYQAVDLARPRLREGSHRTISSRRPDNRAARASSCGPLRSDRTCSACSGRNVGLRCGSWSTPADAIRGHKGGAWRSTPRPDPSILGHHCVIGTSGQRSRASQTRAFASIWHSPPHLVAHLLVNGSLTFSIYHKRHVGVFS